MSFSLINAIYVFWFVRTIKFVLFWIYLWQLKEYHIGRFIDHFRTHQGKKLIFNQLLLAKIVLLPLLAADFLFGWILLCIYIVEFLVFLLQIAKKRFKKPKFTFKTLLLMAVSLVVVALYLVVTLWEVDRQSITFDLLSFDILTPIIVSFVVLVFQPFFVAARNNILKKAKRRMAQFPNLKVIAITGSYGKTSTKEFLTTLLRKNFNVLSTPEHKNSEMGIAQTILESLNNQHEVFIVEMGSYNKGGIKLLCDMVRPSIGIVTGVNQQHLATFGSLENLLSAEGGRELAKHLSWFQFNHGNITESGPKNGLLVVNGDNKYCLDLYKKSQGMNKKIYSVRGDRVQSDIWTEDVAVGPTSISFLVNSRQKEMAHINAKVLGGQNVENLLGAILVAKELGMSMQEIMEACQNIRPEQAGMTVAKGAHGINIIDSSYSSNPNGVMADLDYLHVWPQKKVVIMPCLIELGEVSQDVHYQIGQKIARISDMAIITTKDQFKQIKKGATESGMPADKMIFSDKPQQIFNYITTFCKEGDAVLLEGRVPKELIRLLNGK